MPRDFAAVIRKKMSSDPALAARIQEHAFRSNVADQIYNARIGAGLTQDALASAAGTQQSVIARLENADYDGHSLKMLRRISDALGKELQVAFIDRCYGASQAKAVVMREVTTGVTVNRKADGAGWARMIRNEIMVHQASLCSYANCEQEVAA